MNGCCKHGVNSKYLYTKNRSVAGKITFITTKVDGFSDYRWIKLLKIRPPPLTKGWLTRWLDSSRKSGGGEPKWRISGGAAN